MSILNIINKITSEPIIMVIILALLLVIALLIYINTKKVIEPIEQKSEQELNKEEMSNLHEASIELENIAKQHTIEMTPYEEEQEEKAIISYDELLSKTQNVSISYSDFDTEDDITIKKVDLEKTGKIELDPIKQQTNSKVSISYEHEEEFLQTLKQLQQLLN